jgi:uncharacterized protein with LGFP repeats
MSQHSPIEEHHQRHGGPAGLLGVPTGDEEEIGDAAGGRRRSFRAELLGTRHRLSVPIPSDVPDSTCHHPDAGPRTVVESSIVWSQETGAHAVHGAIRQCWLELGAETGELGYPLSEEHDTPDGLSRRTIFQRGEIWWSPESGAEVRPPS